MHICNYLCTYFVINIKTSMHKPIHHDQSITHSINHDEWIGFCLFSIIFWITMKCCMFICILINFVQLPFVLYGFNQTINFERKLVFIYKITTHVIIINIWLFINSLDFNYCKQISNRQVLLSSRLLFPGTYFCLNKSNTLS